MARVVPQGVVELVGTLKYRGIPVYVEGLDEASSTLRLKLTRSNGWAYGEPQQDLSVLGRDGWVIQDSKDQIWFSPYVDVDDPRLEKVIGDLR